MAWPVGPGWESNVSAAATPFIRAATIPFRKTGDVLAKSVWIYLAPDGAGSHLGRARGKQRGHRYHSFHDFRPAPPGSAADHPAPQRQEDAEAAAADQGAAAEARQGQGEARTGDDGPLQGAQRQSRTRLSPNRHSVPDTHRPVLRPAAPRSDADLRARHLQRREIELQRDSSGDVRFLAASVLRGLGLLGTGSQNIQPVSRTLPVPE